MQAIECRPSNADRGMQRCTARDLDGKARFADEEACCAAPAGALLDLEAVFGEKAGAAYHLLDLVSRGANELHVARDWRSILEKFSKAQTAAVNLVCLRLWRLLKHLQRALKTKKRGFHGAAIALIYITTPETRRPMEPALMTAPDSECKEPLNKPECTALFKAQNQAQIDAAKAAKEERKKEDKFPKAAKEQKKEKEKVRCVAGAASVPSQSVDMDMDGRLVRLSRAMSQLLRHSAASAGVSMDSEGYVSWEEMLHLKKFRGFTEEDVRHVVQNSDKKRFEIKDASGQGLLVRASQGHSQDVAANIDPHKLLTVLPLEQAPAVCIHGTYSSVWPSIQTEGLKRMGRQHIHLTDTLSKLEGQRQVSGFRADCDVLVHVDAARAIAEGLVFYRCEGRDACPVHVRWCVRMN